MSKYLVFWNHPFSNNSIEVNLLEICEKENFNFDKIDATTSETDSAAGRVAAGLQEKTFRLFARNRWEANAL